MFFRLLFLMTFIPFIELYFLVRLSDQIGFGNTLLVVIGTGVLGAWLLRKQGHSILMEMQKSSSQGQIPSDALAKGFFTFLGGVLLLTPGVLTDGLGLSLIFPGTQMLWKRYFMNQWQSGIQSGSIRFYSNMNRGPSPFESQSPFQAERPRRFDPEVIDIDAKSSKVEEKD